MAGLFVVAATLLFLEGLGVRLQIEEDMNSDGTHSGAQDLATKSVHGVSGTNDASASWGWLKWLFPAVTSDKHEAGAAQDEDDSHDTGAMERCRQAVPERPSLGAPETGHWLGAPETGHRPPDDYHGCAQTPGIDSSACQFTGGFQCTSNFWGYGCVGRLYVNGHACCKGWYDSNYTCGKKLEKWLTLDRLYERKRGTVGTWAYCRFADDILSAFEPNLRPAPKVSKFRRLVSLWKRKTKSAEVEKDVELPSIVSVDGDRGVAIAKPESSSRFQCITGVLEETLRGCAKKCLEEGAPITKTSDGESAPTLGCTAIAYNPHKRVCMLLPSFASGADFTPYMTSRDSEGWTSLRLAVR